MRDATMQNTNYGKMKKIFVPCIPGYILTLPNWDFKYPEKWGILALFGNKTPRLKQISKYKYKNAKHDLPRTQLARPREGENV